MFDRERLIAEHDRKQRRRGIRLTVAAALFVLGSAFVFFATGEPVGLVAGLFFGGCLLTGVHLMVGQERLAGRIIFVIAASLAAVGCGAGAVFSALGYQVGRDWQTAGYIVPVMVIAALLFGGAGIVSLVQLVRFLGPNHGRVRHERRARSGDRERRSR